MQSNRGPWYLLTGVFLGVIIGLGYSWGVAPVRFVDNPPSAMREDFKDQYRSLIAIAFTSSHDLGRAQARLALLGDPDPFRILSAQAQRLLAEGGLPGEARALGDLAAAIGPQAGTGASAAGGSPSPAFSSTVRPSATLMPGGTGTGTPAGGTSTLEPTIQPSPTLTRTPLPTRTPTPTPGLPFELVDQQDVCDPELGEPLIQIFAEDVDGNPVPGVAFLISWTDGEEQVFTGLKPEIGIGYADFTMQEGIAYTVSIQDGGLPVPDLVAQECETAGGDRYMGSWELVFRQP
ncbi:MAG: hypothetical protein R3335_03960 [Anaerolineales bacterium]|nr:hypothetical protein [Anaerolineales bacterium]